MTVKERLQEIVAEMTEDEAVDAFALVAGARAGATPVDVYGTAWGTVLADADVGLLRASGTASIVIQDGIPAVE